MADNFIYPIDDIEKVQLFSVAKSNELIYRSLYDLSLMEQRILLCMISTIDSRPVELRENVDERLVYEFDVDTFCNLFNIKKRGSLQLIAAAAKGLRDHSFWRENANGKLETIAWADKAFVDKEKGVITLIFSDDVKPYLLNLSANFTHYELYRVLRFKSKHTLIIYDLIKAACGINHNLPGTYKVTVDELQKRVGVKRDKNGNAVYQYTDFYNLKARIIEPTIAEINKFTDLAVTVEYIKKGRSVTTILFKYAKNKY